MLSNDVRLRAPARSAVTTRIEPLKARRAIAATAEFLHELSGLAREQGNTKTEQTVRALSWAQLECIARSPTVSPMLWYEDIFFDVGQELRVLGALQFGGDL